MCANLWKISGIHDFNSEGKRTSLGLENSQWSAFKKRVDHVYLSASNLLIIKMQAASTLLQLAFFVTGNLFF